MKVSHFVDFIPRVLSFLIAEILAWMENPLSKNRLNSEIKVDYGLYQLTCLVSLACDLHLHKSNSLLSFVLCAKDRPLSLRKVRSKLIVTVPAKCYKKLTVKLIKSVWKHCALHLNLLLTLASSTAKFEQCFSSNNWDKSFSRSLIGQDALMAMMRVRSCHQDLNHFCATPAIQHWLVQKGKDIWIIISIRSVLSCHVC